MDKSITKKRKACPRRYTKCFRRGFSLMELIIAIFIFSLVMTASVGVFSNTIKGYRKTKVIQRDLEEAQFAMNLMAKTLRTSQVVFADTSTVRIYDFSQKKCIEYSFANPDLIFSFTGDDGEYITEGSCATDTLGDPAILVDGNVAYGLFDYNDASGGAGKVTISMGICPDAVCTGNENDSAKIQTTVSLRNIESDSFTEIAP